MSPSSDVVVDVGDMRRSFHHDRRAPRRPPAAALRRIPEPDRATSVYEFDVSIVPPDDFGVDADLDVRVVARPLVARARRLSRRVGPANPARLDSADGESLLGRLRPAYRPHAAPGVARRVPAARLRAGSGTAARSCSPGRRVRGKRPSRVWRLPTSTLLSDEISYVRKVDGAYVAFGTPFAGELGASGEPSSAPRRTRSTSSRGAIAIASSGWARPTR